MRICVDGTANLRCAIRKRFAYHSPRTEICRFFCTNTKKTGCAECPFHAPGILCLPQVHRKLINRAPLTCRMRTVQRISGAFVYTKLNSHAESWIGSTLHANSPIGCIVISQLSVHSPLFFVFSRRISP